MLVIRPAAVAGSFYPAEPGRLRDALAGHLASVEPAGLDLPAASDEPPPKLIVVPHAGYGYSGDVAALAYAPLARWRGRISRVVLLGPVHRVPVRALAAPTVSAFDTPLGPVAIDPAAMASLRTLPQVAWSDRPHAQEHSLEVQLPFLQAVLGDGFKLVPLVVGEASPAEVAEVLERLWGGPETLIVISTDLSHYLPEAQARAIDSATVQRILQLRSDLDPHQACGAAPLNGALQAARVHGLVPQLLGLCTSADAVGMAHADRDRVVGYAAIAFTAAQPPALEDGLAEAELANAELVRGELADREPADNPAALGRALVAIARLSISRALGLPTLPGLALDDALADHPALHQPAATFVSLHDAQGRLRGCIGQLEARLALVDDVSANALGAAFGDPRFDPVSADEWPGLALEVSLLAPAQPLAAVSQADLLAALRPGLDGVILTWRDRRATFLPQVWSQLPSAVDFLAALKRKAGLAADFWAADLQWSTYQVRSFTDHRPEGDAR